MTDKNLTLLHYCSLLSGLKDLLHTYFNKFDAPDCIKVQLSVSEN